MAEKMALTQLRGRRGLLSYLGAVISALVSEGRRRRRPRNDGVKVKPSGLATGAIQWKARDVAWRGGASNPNPIWHDGLALGEEVVLGGEKTRRESGGPPVGIVVISSCISFVGYLVVNLGALTGGSGGRLVLVCPARVSASPRSPPGHTPLPEGKGDPAPRGPPTTLARAMVAVTGVLVVATRSGGYRVRDERGVRVAACRSVSRVDLAPLVLSLGGPVSGTVSHLRVPVSSRSWPSSRLEVSALRSRDTLAEPNPTPPAIA